MITIPSSTNTSICIPAKAKNTHPQTSAEIERIGCSVTETMQLLGISKATVFSLIKENKIHSIKIGKRRIISVQSLRDFVNGKKETPCES